MLTTRGDDMAWLDPGHVPIDFSYNALRAALLAVLRHNAGAKVTVNTVLCPDFISVRNFTRVHHLSLLHSKRVSCLYVNQRRTSFSEKLV